MWLRQWCRKCDILQLNNPILVHEDNQSCINVVRGDCNLNNKQMKHVNIQLHFIKEVVSNNIIKLIYMPTVDMLADLLTKSVSRPILARALNFLGERGDVEYGNITNRNVPSQLSCPNSKLYTINKNPQAQINAHNHRTT
ncbi:hypothetical protein O181_063326 [Austropuccinia psidii MF-1]|uniref:Copia protein n=1 Tax=Austropuccinia psidii MF-1 TaxID=1389203 RepID=A0A9Q3ERK2_9BASI|nr:hypothetical protein [Austropuccinia psidii MF-1]